MLIQNAIARYVHIINPGAPKGSDTKSWSIALLLPKTDPQVAQLQAEVDAQKAAGFPNGFPPRGTLCLVDMAVEEPDNAALAQYVMLKASTRIDGGNKPHFVDASVQPIIDPAGDGNAVGNIVNADVNIIHFDQGNGGVKAYLNGVMDTGTKGSIPMEALSSKPTAAQMFAGHQNANVQAPAAQQTAATPPGPTPPPSAPPETPPAPPFGPVMTDKATTSYEEYIAAGWTDQLLIQHGYMMAPTSFQ